MSTELVLECPVVVRFPESGLYGLLCQLCVERRIACRLTSAAPRGYTLSVRSSASYYHRLFQMDPAGIEMAVDAALAEVPARLLG